jgi:2-keto-4-pentenoate hydratase/2-oxohepta-3-ene-1,7-dioic acid hydratase in catechol pathway
MKLVTYRSKNEHGLGLVDGENIIDLNAAFKSNVGGAFKVKKIQPLDMLGLLDIGPSAIKEVKKVLKGDENSKFVNPLKRVKLLSPITCPRKNIVCLGLNYAEHVREGSRPGQTPRDLPALPIFFTKPPTSVIGPFDNIIYPKVTEKLDYEAELAFVIGKKGKYIPEEKVYDHIAGYTVFNDVSARDLQRSHQQWYRGKSLDTFSPMGPYLVTPDEIGDPQDLEIWCKI